jgi:hypothetical protein
MVFTLEIDILFFINKSLIISRLMLAESEGALKNEILSLSEIAKSVLEIPKSIATYIPLIIA